MKSAQGLSLKPGRMRMHGRSYPLEFSNAESSAEMFLSR